MKNPKTKPQSQNALVHGIYARELVLPWETAEDFTALLESFRADLLPEGPLQEEVVFDIARLHWIKRRAMRAAQIEFHGDPAAEQLIEVGPKGVQEVEKYLRARTDQRETYRADLKEAMGDMVELLKRVTETATAPPQKPAGSSEDRMNEAEATRLRIDALTVAFNVKRQGMQFMREMMELLDTEKRLYERAYRPTELERIVKIESMIDARIEKAIARLAGLKMYRRTYGQKTLPAPV
jgi:hypothetical protein